LYIGAFMPSIVTRIHLYCGTASLLGTVTNLSYYVHQAGEPCLVDTGVRISNATELGLAYSLIERRMLGSQSAKHYYFGLPYGRPGAVDACVVKAAYGRVPAWYGNISGVGQQKEGDIRYVRAFNGASIHEDTFPLMIKHLVRELDAYETWAREKSRESGSNASQVAKR
jgi:hypothetical protein